jgi:hypothetical protein
MSGPKNREANKADAAFRAAPEKTPKKSYNINFRTTPLLRDQLRARAAASGRSVSEEIEYRLNQTFGDDSLLHFLAWGESEATPNLIRLILRTINSVEMDATGGAGTPIALNLKRWNEHPARARELADVLAALLRTVLVEGISPLETAEDYAKELRAAMAGAGRTRSKAESKAWSTLLAAGFVSRGPQRSAAERKAELRARIDELQRELDYIETVERMGEQRPQKATG